MRLMQFFVSFGHLGVRRGFLHLSRSQGGHPTTTQTGLENVSDRVKSAIFEIIVILMIPLTVYAFDKLGQMPFLEMLNIL